MIEDSRPQTELDVGLPKGTLPDFTPVPRLRARRGAVWTAQKQRDFIAALADTGSVQAAVQSVGMGFSAAYRLRRHPEGASFRDAWDAALALGIRRLEDIAMERAMHGVEETVWYQGKAVGTRRVFNDKLLMFMLRNRSGERFLADSWQNNDITTRLSVERLRKQIRAEIEAEMAERQAYDAEKTIASLNDKLERMRERYYENQRFERENPQLYAGVAEAEEAEEEAGEAGAEAGGLRGEPGVARVLPHLLREGDKGLGLPRGGIDPDARRAIAARREGKRLVLPPSAEELAVAGWLRELKAREKMPGVTGVMGVRKDGKKRE